VIELEIQRQLADPGVPEDALIETWVKQAAAGEGKVMLNIRIVDLAEGWALNRQWRGKDSATNVLSFPAEMPATGDYRVLGDVVLCAPVIAREAAEQNKSPQAHWAHLVIHGVLHLLGFDHIDAEHAETMEAREIELMAGLDFSNPYESSHGI
jgi:probable rRNA maturation factor